MSGAAASAGPRTVGEAVGRYWWLPLLLGLLGAAAGLALAYARSPVYTAEASLNAGRLDVQAQAVPGYTQATQALADAYSRVASSAAVLDAVARRTGVPRSTVAREVKATPVPDSSVFRIEARTGDERRAIALANAAADEIVRYARKQTQSGPAPELLERYGAVRARANRLNSQAGALRSNVGNAASGPARRRLTRLQSRANAAQLEADALQQAYISQSISSRGAASVTFLSRAREASSDRLDALQVGGFAGLVTGLLAGGALAALLGARRRRLAASILSGARG